LVVAVAVALVRLEQYHKVQPQKAAARVEHPAEITPEIPELLTQVAVAAAAVISLILLTAEQVVLE
jgi:hypothetical protein